MDRPKFCPIALPPAKYRTLLCVLKSDVYLWLEGASKTPPLQQFCVLVHLATVVEDRPGRLKLGSLVLPPLLCKTYPRELKSDTYFGCSGAPKLTPLTNFCYAAILWQMRSMCHKPAQFVGNGQLFNLFFGFGRTAHWWLRYGPFKSGCRVCACMCMYV